MADPDKLYGSARDLIAGVQTPDSSSLMITLQNMVQQGILTPQQLQTALVDKNAFNNIVTSPEFDQAQQSALSQLQQIGEQGGLDPIAKAQIQDITNSLNQVAQGREQAVQMNARERGIGGSGIELAGRLQGEQSAANQASQQGTNVAAEAQQRALSAIQGAGQLGSQMEAQQYGQQANKAAAQNAINLANAQITNQGNTINTQNANAAQAANLAAQQQIANTNTGTANQQEIYNKQVPQTVYEDALQKAQAQSNLYAGQAGADMAKNSQQKGFNNGLLGGATQVVGKLLPIAGTVVGGIYGGPAGAAAGGAAGSALGGAITKDNGGGPTNESDLPGGYKGGEVHNYTMGTPKVPGIPKVAGDSPKNDTVHAMLSPGEAVVPRSQVSLYHSFTQNMPKPKAKFQQPTNIAHEDIANVLRALTHIRGGKNG